MRPLALAALTASLLATPALAGKITPYHNEHNRAWLDYQTDLSEARRELASDLRRADDAGDRRDARAEYAREVADARNDFEKEMVERGYPVRRGQVTVEPAY